MCERSFFCSSVFFLFFSLFCARQCVSLLHQLSFFGFSYAQYEIGITCLGFFSFSFYVRSVGRSCVLLCCHFWYARLSSVCPYGSHKNMFVLKHSSAVHSYLYLSMCFYFYCLFFFSPASSFGDHSLCAIFFSIGRKYWEKVLLSCVCVCARTIQKIEMHWDHHHQKAV